MISFISRSAIEGRWERVRHWLKEQDYDALAVLQPDNVHYLSGWQPDVAPWERPFVLILPLDKPPFMVLHELSTNSLKMAGKRGSIYVDDITLYLERPSTTRRTWSRPQWAELVAQQLKEHGLGRANLAVDGPTGPFLNRVTSVLSRLHLTSEPKLLQDLRSVKDSEELELMKHAASLTDFGQQVFKSLVKPEKLVADIDAETTRQMRVEGAKRFPKASLEARCFSLSGPESAAPHGTGAGSDSCFETGHGIVNIVVVRLNGYPVENERTWFVGKPNDDQRQAFECIRRAQAAAIDCCVAGKPVSAIDAAAQTIIEAGGYADHIVHRTGHGIGLGGHEFPEDMAFNHRPLLEGEVYTIEPGIYIYGLGGFRLDDTVFVDDAPEVITTTPKDIDSQTIAV